MPVSIIGGTSDRLTVVSLSGVGRRWCRRCKRNAASHQGKEDNRKKFELRKHWAPSSNLEILVSNCLEHFAVCLVRIASTQIPNLRCIFPAQGMYRKIRAFGDLMENLLKWRGSRSLCSLSHLSTCRVSTYRLVWDWPD